ncbi:hypothetical protein Vretimale_13141 [Volvox reticuliferus]|nr:hypothetical protein Vretimale_13141 [Volvox reticuliferus]
MPLKLPDFLKRMVGLDSVAVSEVQRVVWHGGGAFTVMSETNITNMLGAGRFTTALQLTVTEPQQPSPAASTGEGSHEGQAAESRGAGGDSASAMVQVVYSVRCATGSIPWPMSATIENVMSEKALVSMQSFLDFCTQLLEEQAAVSAAAAVAAAKLGGAVAPTVASGDAAITPAAAAALLEPVARVSDTGTTSVAAAAGGPWGGGSAGAAPLNSRNSIRHRWPSITCSQDLGNVGLAGVGIGVTGGDLFKLQRADTMGTAGGGDVFWDAPENFASVGSVSGVSSSAVSPRHLLLQPNSLRRLSGDSGATAMAAGGLCTATASAVTVNAVATETHQVAVAVDKLATAVATLDNKIEKLLHLHEDQQLLIRHIQELQQRQQLQQDPPAYMIDHPPESRTRSNDQNGADARSDVRWMFRVALAVLLATLLLVTYWMVHPYAGGFRPHSSRGDGGGSGAPPERVPVASVLRLNGGDGSLGARGGDFRSGGGEGGSGDLEGRHARLTLQKMHRMVDSRPKRSAPGGELQRVETGSNAIRRRRRRGQRQQP